MSDVKNKVYEYLKTTKTVSIATCNNGKPSCRIMEMQGVGNDLEISFVAHKSTPKIEQMTKCQDACIVSYNSEVFMDVRLFGKVKTFDDMDTKKGVWKDQLKDYFPKGVDDPELVVIKFSPEMIEYRNLKEGSMLPETEVL